MKNLKFIALVFLLFALSDCKKDSGESLVSTKSSPAFAKDFTHSFPMTQNDQYWILTQADATHWQVDGAYGATLTFRDLEVRAGYVYGYFTGACVVGSAPGYNNYTIVTGENEIGRTFSFQVTYCTGSITTQKVSYNFDPKDSGYNAFIHSIGILNDGMGFDLVSGGSSDIGEMDPSTGTYTVTRVYGSISSCDSQRVIALKFIAHKNADGTYSYAVAPLGYNDSPMAPTPPAFPPPSQI
jgi:hypothetical protein